MEPSAMDKRTITFTSSLTSEYISFKLLLITVKFVNYSEIPLLRPPKIKPFYPLKNLFARLKLFFSSFSTPSVSLFRDHLWDCPKVVFKTTFGSPKGGLNIGILLY